MMIKEKRKKNIAAERRKNRISFNEEQVMGNEKKCILIGSLSQKAHRGKSFSSPFVFTIFYNFILPLLSINFCQLFIKKLFSITIDQNGTETHVALKFTSSLIYDRVTIQK